MPRAPFGFITGALLILSSCNAVAAPVQWTVGLGGNGHWYDLVFPSGTLDWFDARDAASSILLGGSAGHLVTITSADENAFVRDTFVPLMTVQKFLTGADQDGDFAFIGLTDSNVEAQFEWITGEPFSYEDFGPFEPSSGNASFGNLQDFGIVRILEDGRTSTGPLWQWDDNYLLPTVGAARLGYIVEFENVQAVSEPGSLLPAFSGCVSLLLAGALRQRRIKARVPVGC